MSERFVSIRAYLKALCKYDLPSFLKEGSIQLQAPLMHVTGCRLSVSNIAHRSTNASRAQTLTAEFCFQWACSMEQFAISPASATITEHFQTETHLLGNYMQCRYSVSCESVTLPPRYRCRNLPIRKRKMSE